MESNLRSFLRRLGASVYPPSTLSCWLLPANYVGFLCAIGRRYHAPSHLSSLSRALSARHLTTFAVAFRFFFPGKRHRNLIWFSTYSPVLHIIFTGLPAREKEKVGGRGRRKRESDGRYAAWNLSTHNAEIRVEWSMYATRAPVPDLVSRLYSFLMGELMELDYASLGPNHFFANPCGISNILQWNDPVASLFCLPTNIRFIRRMLRIFLSHVPNDLKLLVFFKIRSESSHSQQRRKNYVFS